MSGLHLHCPKRKLQIKKRYYRAMLVAVSAAIWWAHEYMPHYEMHVAFLTNLMFAVDPTA